MRHRKIHATETAAADGRDVRAREIPLAVVMVALTTLTLWSLGQAIVQEAVAEGAPPAESHRREAPGRGSGRTGTRRPWLSWPASRRAAPSP